MYDKKIKVNTKNKGKIERFDEHYTSNMARIKYMLDNKIYKPYKYNIFLVREPKVRLIMAQSITDKIVNHLVSKYFLVDVFEPLLIDNNIAACMLNKGANLREVQELLGCENLSTTTIYTHLTNEKLRRTYLDIHP